MSNRTVLIRTDASGDFVYERPFAGEVRAFQVTLGELVSGCSVRIEDADNGSVVFDDVIVADGIYTAAPDSGFPAVNGPFVIGTLRVTVANGGDTKSGSVRILTKT